MKKKTWARRSKLRTQNKSLQKAKKYLKRKRSKARRRSKDPIGFEKTDGSWDIA